MNLKIANLALGSGNIKDLKITPTGLHWIYAYKSIYAKAWSCDREVKDIGSFRFFWTISSDIQWRSCEDQCTYGMVLCHLLTNICMG